MLENFIIGRSEIVFQIKNYVQAKSLEEAYQLNQKKNNIILGGMMWLKMSNRIIQNAIDLSGLGLDKIEETQEEVRIGAMCTLRQIETHKGLEQAWNGVLRACVEHIVGVQFRNTATIGGSVYGRFGFSDMITCLLSLDTYVELYQGGVMSLKEFVCTAKDNDILTHIKIKKEKAKFRYLSQRMTATDFPILACGISKLEDGWRISVGARPMCARSIWIEEKEEKGQLEQTAREAASQFTYGSNMRGSMEYREHLAEVYIRRGMEAILKES